MCQLLVVKMATTPETQPIQSENRITLKDRSSALFDCSLYKMEKSNNPNEVVWYQFDSSDNKLTFLQNGESLDDKDFVIKTIDRNKRIGGGYIYLNTLRTVEGILSKFKVRSLRLCGLWFEEYKDLCVSFLTK